MSESSNLKTYVYNEVEVVLTGREAKRERDGRRGIVTDVRVEITPADKEEGSWKKWVKMKELFEVVNEEND